MDGDQWLQVSEVRRCLTSPLQASGLESWQALESPWPWASDLSHTLEAHSRESPGLSQIYKCSSFVCRGDARVYMFTSAYIISPLVVSLGLPCCAHEVDGRWAH